MVIGKAEYFVNLSIGRLRELQTGLWGADVRKEICVVAVFTANKTDADAHGLKLKPLSAEARAIAGKLPALVRPQEDEVVATILGGDLEEEVQAGGGEQNTPVEPGGGLKRSPYAVAKRTTGDGDCPDGMTSKEGDEMKSASSAKGGSKGGAAGQAESAAGAGKGSKKAGVAPARGKELVYQPTPSTGMKRSEGTPAPDPNDDKRV